MRIVKRAALALVLIGLCLGVGTVWAADANRAGKKEFYVPIRWTSSETFTADGGSTFDVNEDVGWGFGFGYNVSDNVVVQMDFTWQSASFNANLMSDVGATTTVGGSLDSTTTLIALQYNILPKTFTPFVIGGVGWTWADSNIPTAPPQGTCWWTWVGLVCDSWQPTATESAFAYGVGAGLRGDFGDSLFLEVSYTWSWADFDVADEFNSVRLDVGWKF